MKNIILVLTVLLIVFSANACNSDSQKISASDYDSYSIENSGFYDNLLLRSGDNNNFGTLSPEQITSITHMREEEKLARDVYKTFSLQYSLPVFRNITKSEQVHMNAIKRIITNYGLQDPVVNDQTGIFTDSTFTGLYNQLITLGAASLNAALDAGATIEEIDILDLISEINLFEANPDIKIIYKNLTEASKNHLRAFVKTLKARGIVYSPKYLSPELFYAIMNG